MLNEVFSQTSKTERVAKLRKFISEEKSITCSLLVVVSSDQNLFSIAFPRHGNVTVTFAKGSSEPPFRYYILYRLCNKKQGRHKKEITAGCRRFR